MKTSKKMFFIYTVAAFCSLVGAAEAFTGGNSGGQTASGGRAQGGFSGGPSNYVPTPQYGSSQQFGQNQQYSDQYGSGGFQNYDGGYRSGGYGYSAGRDFDGSNYTGGYGADSSYGSFGGSLGNR